MNQHVTEYCKNYISMKTPPSFAILIKGAWGCGKTHFVESLLSSIVSNQILKQSEVVKLSLYGITSVSELDERMYQELHPFLSSKFVRYLGAFLRTSLKAGTNIDINGDGTKEVSLSLGGREKRKTVKLSKIEKKLIVIDDLERTTLDHTTIFGYFSEYVFEFGLKAIFIGNEIEIRNSDNYTKIKEKIIGMEFLVQPCIANAIDSFVKELEFENYTDLIVNSCKSVVQVLQFENLRAVRQCFYNLKLFLSIFPSKIEERYVVDIIESFIVLFLQKSTGAVKDVQSKLCLAVYKNYNLSFKDYEEKNKPHKNSLPLFYSKIFLLEDLWQSIIFDGNYLESKILDSFNSALKENNPKEFNSLFKLMNTWRSLSKDEFLLDLSILRKDFQSAKYLHPGEIIHFVNLQCAFSGWGIIEETYGKIKDTALEFVKLNESKIHGEHDWDNFQDSYAGWSFNYQIKEVREVSDFLKKVSYENYLENLRIQLVDFLNGDEFNFKDFIRDITHSNGTSKYYDIPILHLIGAIEFRKLVERLTLDDKDNLIYALSERYGEKYSNNIMPKEYHLDVDVLESLLEGMSQLKPEVLNNPLGFREQQIIEKFRKLLEYAKKTN